MLKRPEGLMMIDTGLTSKVTVQWIFRRFAPAPSVRRDQEVGPAMRRAGLDPSEVRTVVVTHLDWDHIGGVGHFADAAVHVHREGMTSRQVAWVGREPNPSSSLTALIPPSMTSTRNR